jgi:hyperosmotically inducible periplasmic protein
VLIGWLGAAESVGGQPERPPGLELSQLSDLTRPGWVDQIGRFWSDAVITQTVKRDLARERFATLLDVSVSTEQGTVSLSGNVESAAEKQRAELIAGRVKGVVRVVNNLTVQAAETP